MAAEPGGSAVFGVQFAELSAIRAASIWEVLAQMPWRFRKIVRLGPMRGWLSRTGIGYSWGFPGFRIGVAADGRRYFSIGIPGTGLYFYKFFSRSRRGKPPIPPPASGHIPGPTAQRPPSPTPTPNPTVPSPPQANQPPWWRQKNLP